VLDGGSIAESSGPFDGGYAGITIRFVPVR
jgi:hypothetical protein